MLGILQRRKPSQDRRRKAAQSQDPRSDGVTSPPHPHTTPRFNIPKHNVALVPISFMNFFPEPTHHPQKIKSRFLSMALHDLSYISSLISTPQTMNYVSF